MLINPHATGKEIAAKFGLSTGHVYTIINSDIFQSRLHEKKDYLFCDVVGSITNRLTGLAGVAIERLTEQAEFVNDPEQLRKIVETAVKALGYGTAKGGNTYIDASTNNTQNNQQTVVDADVLRRAREKIGRPAIEAAMVRMESAGIPEEDGDQSVAAPGVFGGRTLAKAPIVDLDKDMEGFYEEPDDASSPEV